MSNTFGVNAAPETVDRLNKMLDDFAQNGEKKSETLQRIFKIATDNANNDALQRGGVDINALDATLGNIRVMFAAAVNGRDQIQTDCDMKIADIRAKKDQLEADLRARISAAEGSAKEAAANAEAARKEADQAEKDLKAAQEQADTAAKLAAEKDKTIESRDKTIASQAALLTIANEKADAYDNLMKEKQAADTRIKDLESQAQTNQKDHEREVADLKEQAQRAAETAQKDKETDLRELQAKMNHAVSDAKKDAQLAQEKAVQEAIAKTRMVYEDRIQDIRDKVQQQLREADRESARLQAKIDMQAEQIKDLQSKIIEFESREEIDKQTNRAGSTD